MSDGGWRRWLRDAEDLLVVLALAALVLVPLGEIVLRRVFHTGITGATAFQQHLTLLIGLLGGALAARERRLLTLSTLLDCLTGKGKLWARVFSSALAAGISVFLCMAAAQLVQTEKEAGKILAYGIPLWTVQLIMPLGFGVSMTTIAVQTYINRRVPYRLQGRAFALQSTLKNGAAILPLLTLGAVASVVGVSAVLVFSPLALLVVGAAMVRVSERFGGHTSASELEAFDSFWGGLEEPTAAASG